MIRLEHVCVVHRVRPDGSHGRGTSIDKRPVEGPVRIGVLGPEGDSVRDTHHHGGRFRAVYVVSDEDAGAVETGLLGPARLGQAGPGAEAGPGLPVGWLGENLRVSGAAMSEVLVGERWRIGGCELVFSGPRIPCQTLARWVHQLTGRPERGTVQRFTELGRPGGMAEVVVPGTVRAGDDVTVLRRPEHGMTIGEAFVTMPGDKAAALLDSTAPEDLRPDLLRRARTVAGRPVS